MNPSTALQFAPTGCASPLGLRGIQPSRQARPSLPYGLYKFVILSIAKNLTSHNVNLTVCREQPLCCSEKTQQNFTGERSSPLRLVHSPLVFAKFNLARAGTDFLRKQAPFCLLCRHFPCQGNYPPLRVARCRWDCVGFNRAGRRERLRFACHHWAFQKKRREQAPALRILHLRLAYHTSMPSFFAARRVKSSRASRQNVKPNSAPSATSVRKCLPIIMRVKPSSHV